LGEIVMASHAEMTAEAFTTSRSLNWAATAVHPDTGLRFADMTYQPMTELLRYLRDEGFSTWIVTGGGSHFVRAFAEDAYGIPPEQVVGSMIDSEYRVIDGKGQIWKLPELAFIDDKGGKPVGIDRSIGRRPILAFGNSDGDFEMLEYATTGPGPSLGLILHHTDGAREWAYDRESHIGKLNRGLDESAARGWIMVDMAADWSRIYTGGNSKGRLNLRCWMPAASNLNEQGKHREDLCNCRQLDARRQQRRRAGRLLDLRRDALRLAAGHDHPDRDRFRHDRKRNQRQRRALQPRHGVHGQLPGAARPLGLGGGSAVP
jgi:hypothetical protein